MSFINNVLSTFGKKARCIVHYSIIIQYFVTTVSAGVWDRFSEEALDRRVYAEGLGHSMRFEVINKGDFKYSVYVHDIDNNRKTSKLLVNGKDLRFVGDGKTHIVGSYSDLDYDFWIDKDGNLKISSLTANCNVDLVTNFNVTINSFKTSGSARIFANRLNNDSETIASGVLRIKTNEAITNSNLLQGTARTHISSKNGVLNSKGSRIFGGNVKISSDLTNEEQSKVCGNSVKIVSKINGCRNINGLIKANSILDFVASNSSATIFNDKGEISGINLSILGYANLINNKGFILGKKSNIAVLNEIANTEGATLSGTEYLTTKSNLFKISDSSVLAGSAILCNKELSLVGNSVLKFDGDALVNGEKLLIADKSKVTCKKSIQIDSKEIEFNSGLLEAVENIGFTGKYLINDGGEIIAKNIEIGLSSDISYKDLKVSLSNGRISNEAKKELAKRGSFINRGSVTSLNSLKILADGFLFNESGIISSSGDLDIYAKYSIKNDKRGIISGSMVPERKASRKFSLKSLGNISNTEESVIDCLCDGIIESVEESIENSSSTIKSFEGSLLVKSGGSIRNTDGILISKNKLEIIAGKDFYNFQTNGKSLVSSKLIDISSKGVSYNSGGACILADESFRVKAGHLDNQNGKIYAKGIRLTLGEEINPTIERKKKSKNNPHDSDKKDKDDDNTSEKTEEDLREDAACRRLLDGKDHGNLINSDGEIISDDGIEIVSTGEIFNTGNGVIDCRSGDISIASEGRFFNSNKATISSLRNILIRSKGVLNNESTIVGGCVLLDSALFVLNSDKSSVVSNVGNIELRGIIVDNAGTVASSNCLSVCVIEGFRNSGVVQSNGDFTVVSGAEKTYVKNTGSICSQTGNVQLGRINTLINDGGLIQSGISVLSQGEITLSNVNGKIISDKDILFEKIYRRKSNKSNENGIILAKEIVNLGSRVVSLNDFGGDICAKKIVASSKSCKSGNIELKTLFSGAALSYESIDFDCSNLFIVNNSDFVFEGNASIIANDFLNRSRLLSRGSLSIRSKAVRNENSEIIKKDGESNFCYINFDNDIENNPDIKGVFGKNPTDGFYYSKTKKPSNSLIFAKGNLELFVTDSLNNLGAIESEGNISIKGTAIFNGYAIENIKKESLKSGSTGGGTFSWGYDVYKSQGGHIFSRGKTFIDNNGGRTINTFGTICSNDGFEFVNSEIFLNLGGKVNVRTNGTNAKVSSKYFINMMGSIKTSIEQQRYWSIKYAYTDPAFFTVHGGALDIDSDHFRNSAGMIYGENGVFINGKDAKEVAQAINKNLQLTYCHMVTRQGVNITKETNRFCGISCGSSTTYEYWRSDTNETESRETLIGSISSGERVEISKSFPKGVQKGLVHAPQVDVKADIHGFQKNIKLPGSKVLPNVLDTLPWIERNSDGYLMPNAPTEQTVLAHKFDSVGGNRINLAIIRDKSIPASEMSNLKLVLSPFSLESLVWDAAIHTYGTGHFKSFKNLAEGTTVAYKTEEKSKSSIKVSADNFAHLKPFICMKDSGVNDVLLVEERSGLRGIFFKVKNICGQWALVPVVYLGNSSSDEMNASEIHPFVGRSDGATIVEGHVPMEHAKLTDCRSKDIKLLTSEIREWQEKNAALKIRSSGHTKLAGAIYSDNGAHFDFGGDVDLKTRYHIEYGITRNEMLDISGNFISSCKTTRKVEELRKLSKPEDPTVIVVGRGNLSFAVPKDAKVGIKGVSLLVDKDIFLSEGKHTLESLRYEDIVKCEVGGDGGRESTVVPMFLQTVIQSGGCIVGDISSWNNKGCVLRGFGDVFLKTKDFVQSFVAEKYVASEGYKTKKSLFTEYAQSAKQTAYNVSAPEMTGKSIRIETDKFSGQGEFKTIDGSFRLRTKEFAATSDAVYNEMEVHDSINSVLYSVSTDVKKKTPHVMETKITVNGGDFDVECVGDYLEKGVVIEVNGGGIKRVVGGNKDISGLRVEETTDMHQVFRGISIFGVSDSIFKIAEGKFGEALESFANNFAITTYLKNCINAKEDSVRHEFRAFK